MIEIVVSVFITLVVVLFAGWGLARMARPWVGRDQQKFIRLLERVLAGQAVELEWRVFMSIPMRHNLFLEEKRLQCQAIEEDHWHGLNHRNRLFSKEGEQLLQQLLDEIKSHGEREF